MGKIFQLRTKIRLNSKIDKGFVFNCPSNNNSSPTANDVKAALTAIGGKEAAVNGGNLTNFEILS